LEVQRGETDPDYMTQVAANAEAAPVELLREANLRGEARRREERVDGVGLNDPGVARVVDARVEMHTRGKALLVLPAEADGGAGSVKLAVPLERDAPVDEPVEPLIAAL